MFDLECTVSPHWARIRSVFAPPQVIDEIFSRWAVLGACALLVHAKKEIRAAGLCAVLRNALRTLLGRKKRASSDARPFSLERRLFDELDFDLDQHARRHEAGDLHGGARRQIRLFLGAE